MRVLCLLAAAATAWGAQSLQLTSTSGSVTLPGSSPFARADQVNADFYYEFRVHTITTPGSNKDFWQTSGQTFFCTLMADGRLNCTDWFDTLDDNNSFVQTSGLTDYVVRMVRKASTHQFWIEVWSIDGTSYSMGQVRTISGPGTGPSSGGGTARVSNFSFGTSGLTAQLAWFRWRPGAIASGAVRPKDYDSLSGALAAWEFEGNGADSSSYGNTLSMSGASYATTPTYAPACDAGTTQSFRTTGITFDASRSTAFTSPGTLSYKWTLTSKPSGAPDPIWSGKTSVSATITGLIFGSYVASLTVTDSAGQSSTCSMKHGAVVTDAKGIVIVPPAWAAHSSILGPMVRWGASPWARHTAMHKGWADKQLIQFGVPGPNGNGVPGIWPYWDAQYGTATAAVTANSKTVTISGGDAQVLFCGGTGNTTTASATKYIVIWWGASEQYRHGDQVHDCPDSTHITLEHIWLSTQGTQSGKHFAKASDTEIGRWGNQSTNANYYDNVMAFYALYLSSGLDDYLTAARQLADWWYVQPNFDQGYGCDLNGGSLCPPTRTRALTGLFLRALDGRSDMFDGLDRAMQFEAYFTEQMYAGGDTIKDIREQAYPVAWLSLCAMYSPTLSNSCKLWAKHGLNNFIRQQRADGRWEALTTSVDNGYAGSLSDSRYRGTVTVTHGSNTVDLTGATALDPTPSWTSAEMNGRRFWTLGCDYDYTTGDTTFYTSAYVSPTRITIDRPYEGASSTCKVWQSGDGWMGYGTQPFMMGITIRSVYMAMLAMHGYDATAESQARTAVISGANFLTATGFNPVRKDLWYGLNFANACPVGNYCWSLNPDRNLQGEILGALSLAYLLSGDDTLKDAAESMMGGAWGDVNLGEPGATDATWLEDFFFGGFSYAYDLGKYFGFWWGFGASEDWAAARLGQVTSTISRTLFLTVNPSRHAGATKARVRLLNPQGVETVTATCTAVCSIPADARFGTHVATLEYLNASDAVVASTAAFPAGVQ